MKDLVIHCPDLLALNAEGQAIAADPEHPLNSYFTVDDDGSLTFNAFKYVHYYVTAGTPETVSIARVSRDVIEQCESLVALGEVNNDGSYTFDSTESEETYDRLRGDLRHVDDEGNEWFEPRWLMALA